MEFTDVCVQEVYEPAAQDVKMTVMRRRTFRIWDCIGDDG